MKRLTATAFSFFLLLAFPLVAQDNDGDDLNPRAEPYPAPISYAEVSQLEASFLSLFSDENVTNTHIYATAPAELDNGYPYTGTPITSEFNGFLPKKLAGLTFRKGQEPRAVMRLRGNGNELYVLRLPTGTYNGELALFAMDGEQLRPQEMLAYRRCNSVRCVQQDSWLQDVNGDGRLDIIQKKKVTRGYKEPRTKTTVLIMQPNGRFKKDRRTDIAEGTYIMAPVERDR